MSIALSMPANKSVKISPNFLDVNGNLAAAPVTPTWTTSDNTKTTLTPDPATGLSCVVTGLGTTGVVTITCTAGALVDTAVITLTAAASPQPTAASVKVSAGVPF
jgi:hypothetical protein